MTHKAVYTKSGKFRSCLVKDETGQTCIEILRRGDCLMGNCIRFGRVKSFYPKLKHYYETVVKGVIPFTVWDFSEKAEQQRQKRTDKARVWLEKYEHLFDEEA